MLRRKQQSAMAREAPEGPKGAQRQARGVPDATFGEAQPIGLGLGPTPFQCTSEWAPIARRAKPRLPRGADRRSRREDDGRRGREKAARWSRRGRGKGEKDGQEMHEDVDEQKQLGRLRPRIAPRDARRAAIFAPLHGHPRKRQLSGPGRAARNANIFARPRPT